MENVIEELKKSGLENLTDALFPICIGSDGMRTANWSGQEVHAGYLWGGANTIEVANSTIGVHPVVFIPTVPDIPVKSHRTYHQSYVLHTCWSLVLDSLKQLSPFGNKMEILLSCRNGVSKE